MKNKSRYIPRIIDMCIERRMKFTGAIVIEGAKWSGKTETGKNFAKSIFNIADPSGNFSNRTRATLDPISILTSNKTPILIDEWQDAPGIWDAVKQQVDILKTNGNFILTGSATPQDDARIHSGEGRFSRIKMRPLSLLESGISTGIIKLDDLFKNRTISVASGKLKLESLAQIIIKGGWPRIYSSKLDYESSKMIVRNYIDSLILSKVPDRNGNINRDPSKMRQLIVSLARNTSTLVEMKTIYTDINQNEVLSRPTVINYIDVLKRLFAIEEIPPWAPTIRSSVRLRKSPKTIFVDPSLAASALQIDDNVLTSDLNTYGFLFENLVLRDLLIYAESIGATISHYHDNTDLEVDAIITKDNGEWGAFEIKLGVYNQAKAIASLLRFKNKSTEVSKTPPSFLAIIVGVGATSQKTKEGVYIIPIDCLGV